MGVATTGRFAIVLLTILTVGLSLGSPVEDIPETAYDESEAPPYEAIPLFSIVLPLAAARTTQARQSSLHPEPVAASRFALAHVRDTGAKRSAGARISLALLCALLC